MVLCRSMNKITPINRNPYNLRQSSQFSRPRINTVYHGAESISNFGPKIWDLVPKNLKKISDLDKFKKTIKQWKPEDFPCRLCIVFVQNVGFGISRFGNTHFCAVFCALHVNLRRT